MQKLFLIKYGELNTKKANIGLFLKTLQKNIMNELQDITCDITFDKGRMYIKTAENNFELVKEKLSKIFGIHEIAIGYELENNSFELLTDNLIQLLQEKDFKTFKINTKRSDKNYFLTSPEINQKLGGVVLKNIHDVKVDVNNPEIIINVEIRKTNAYIYFETIKGLGGYPTSTLGKGLLMLSGGIDSPVAGFLAMKRGVKLECIYFDSPPHTSIEAKNKVITLANIIGQYQGHIKVHVIPFTKIQETIYKEVPNEYMIIRPVACFDKLEIIALAKKINTYETSILPYQDCCTIFVPEHPVIYPTLDKCIEYEQHFDYESLINEALKNGLQNCYNNWITLINEYMVRAVQIFLDIDIMEKDYIKQLILNHQKIGYIHIEEIINLLKNKNNYNNFKEFYKKEIVNYFIELNNRLAESKF